MTTVKGGQVGETKKGRNKNKSLGMALFWSGYGAFIYFLYFIFHLIQRHFLLLTTLDPAIHPFILTLPLNLII